MSANEAGDSMQFGDFETALHDPVWQAAFKAMLDKRKAAVAEGRAQLEDWEVAKRDILERVKTRPRRVT